MGNHSGMDVAELLCQGEAVLNTAGWSSDSGCVQAPHERLPHDSDGAHHLRAETHTHAHWQKAQLPRQASSGNPPYPHTSLSLRFQFFRLHPNRWKSKTFTPYLAACARAPEALGRFVPQKEGFEG